MKFIALVLFPATICGQIQHVRSNPLWHQQLELLYITQGRKMEKFYLDVRMRQIFMYITSKKACKEIDELTLYSITHSGSVGLSPLTQQNRRTAKIFRDFSQNALSSNDYPSSDFIVLYLYIMSVELAHDEGDSFKEEILATMVKFLNFFGVHYIGIPGPSCKEISTSINLMPLCMFYFL